MTDAKKPDPAEARAVLGRPWLAGSVLLLFEALVVLGVANIVATIPGQRTGLLAGWLSHGIAQSDVRATVAMAALSLATIAATIFVAYAFSRTPPVSRADGHYGAWARSISWGLLVVLGMVAFALVLVCGFDRDGWWASGSSVLAAGICSTFGSVMVTDRTRLQRQLSEARERARRLETEIQKRISEQPALNSPQRKAWIRSVALVVAFVVLSTATTGAIVWLAAPDTGAHWILTVTGLTAATSLGEGFLVIYDRAEALAVTVGAGSERRRRRSGGGTAALVVLHVLLGGSLLLVADVWGLVIAGLIAVVLVAYTVKGLRSVDQWVEQTKLKSAHTAIQDQITRYVQAESAFAPLSAYGRALDKDRELAEETLRLLRQLVEQQRNRRGGFRAPRWW